VSGRRRVLLAATEAGALLLLVFLPLAIWHALLADVLDSFHLAWDYFIGELTPWFLLLAGIAFLVPVAASAGLHPENPRYPRARKAYASWGVVLYLLGVILMMPVAEIWTYQH
jgi:hypothetical protein